MQRRLIVRLLIPIILLSVIYHFKPGIFFAVKKSAFEVLVFPLHTANNVKNYFVSRSACMKENARLKQENMALNTSISRMSGLAKENERLKVILGFKKKLPFKSVAAKVIGKVPLSWTDSVLINKGSKESIKRRMAVCTAKGLVGTVTDVGTNSSNVMLISDPESRVGVVLEKSRQTGIMVGMPSGGAKVIYLDLASEVTQGEVVYTSSLGGIYPEGIKVGYVYKVGVDSVGLYKFAIVKPYQNLNSMEEVLCVE